MDLIWWSSTSGVRMIRTSCRFGLGLLDVAVLADRLQVGLVVRAAFGLRSDVIHLVGQRDAPCSVAGLTHVLVAGHHCVALAAPGPAASSLAVILDLALSLVHSRKPWHRFVAGRKARHQMNSISTLPRLVLSIARLRRLWRRIGVAK